jgi:hypothetical protein
MTSPNERCATEPISFLRLERYRLHELTAREERAVSEHLAGCAVCRSCLASIEEDVVLPPLPALSVPAKPRPQVAALIELRDAAKRVRARRLMALSGSVTGALALAAAALLMLRPKPEDSFADGVRPARVGVKGGDVAVELVRQHRGALADPALFADGDSFKVLVTCPPPLAPHFDVVVYQAGQAYFPLASGTLESCGNRQALAGAFTLDGAAAVVCVALDAQEPPSRARLGQGPDALPDLSVCTRVAPQGAER